MSDELSYLLTGTMFGLGAGLTPGPLMTLVFTETLKHGTREGIKVSLAPLITDPPIIVISIYLFSGLSDFSLLIGIISVVGAAYVVYLGYESITFKGVELDANKIPPRSIIKGILSNLLNPNPYIFWVSVGAPIILKAAQVNKVSTLGFLLGMYFFLVGSKITTAIILGKSRQFLKNIYYIYLLRVLGIALFIFAFIYFKDGLQYLGLF
jgi:threonine/homoserine/homoserine lactone efflux protein